MADPTLEQIASFLGSRGLMVMPAQVATHLYHPQPLPLPPQCSGGGGAIWSGVRAGTYNVGGASITVNGKGQVTSIVPGGGGGGAVNSVFGRVGNVVAVAGDYTAAQISAAGPGPATDVQAALNALAVAPPTLHGSTHISTGSDPIPIATEAVRGTVEFAANGEVAGSLAVQANDSRLSDARPPTSHGSTHISTGSDPIPIATDTVRGTVEFATDGEVAGSLAVQANDGRLSNARTPTAHAASHQLLGSDQINVAGLSGLLADPQTPTSHGASHISTGSDPIPIATDTVRGTVEFATDGEVAPSLAVQANDGRLSDARTPTAHAASHAYLGSDSLAPFIIAMATALVAGAVPTDAPANADDVIIGDGTAVDRGVTIYTGVAQTGFLNFADTAGNSDGGLSYAHATDALFLRAAAANRITVTAANLGPVTGNAVDLGLTGTRYRDGYWDGNLYVDGGTAAGAPANSNIVVGDAVGDHGIGIVTGDANVGYLMFARAAAPTTVRGGVSYYNTQNYLAFWANAGVRVLVNTGGIFPNTTATYASGTAALRWTDEFLSRGLFIGGVQADGAAGADEIVIGDGSAANFGMSIYTGPAAIGRINFNDTAGGAQGQIRYDHNFDSMVFTAASVARVYMNSAALAPITNDATTLGESTARWSTTWSTLYKGGGATTETGSTNADEIILGTVATAAIGMTINTTTTGIGRLAFADVDGASLNGGLQYEHTGDLLKFFAGTVALAQVSATALAPVTDGVGTLGTSSLGWDQIWISERTGAPGGSSTRGVIYIDDATTPNQFFVMPDDGTPRNISRMPSIVMGPGGNSNAAVTAVVDATSFQAYLPFADTVTTFGVWEVQIPYTYGGQPLTLTVHYSGDVAAGGNVRWARNFRRYVVGELSTVLNSTTTNSTVATSGVQFDQQSSALSTNVGIDSAVAGDWVRVYIARLGGDAADTYTGVVRLHAVTLSETVT